MLDLERDSAQLPLPCAMTATLWFGIGFLQRRALCSSTRHARNLDHIAQPKFPHTLTESRDLAIRLIRRQRRFGLVLMQSSNCAMNTSRAARTDFISSQCIGGTSSKKMNWRTFQYLLYQFQLTCSFSATLTSATAAAYATRLRKFFLATGITQT